MEVNRCQTPQVVALSLRQPLYRSLLALLRVLSQRGAQRGQEIVGAQTGDDLFVVGVLCTERLQQLSDGELFVDSLWMLIEEVANAATSSLCRAGEMAESMVMVSRG